MAITKFLARDLVFEVAEGGSGSSYIPVGGVESLSHSPSTEIADTTDFGSQGRKEMLVAERGDEWTITGFYMEDVLTGERDAGQERIEAIAAEISTTSVGTFRITCPGGNRIDFNAIVEVTLHGGGHNDPAAWGAKLTVSGFQTFTPGS